MSERDRFERRPGEAACGNKIRNRGRGEPVGDFLARLWTLFGPPDHVGDEGFHYSLRDRRTGLRFDAYSAGSGPAYGGAPQDHATLGPVLEALDALLETTAPADCAIEYETELGRYRVGARGGRPFESPVPVDAERLRRELDDAEVAVGKASGDPWMYLGPLAALDAAWRRAAATARAPLETRARAIAAALLRATVDAGAKLANVADGDPIRAPFVDAGLDQLRELDTSPLLAGENVAQQVAALRARLSSSS